ncbi:vesicle-trafficking protein SEC22c-like protein [Camelus ferus]|nr:vesicle-trafficking protein SEC22c-like protein [Camelus ferus]
MVGRRLKTLALRLAQYPGRGSAEGRDFNIQGVQSQNRKNKRKGPGLTPGLVVLLDWKDHDLKRVPGDGIIQKVKWHFNYVSSTQMESSLERIQEELKFQPPVVLSLEDTDVANGVVNGHPRVTLEPAPNFRMEPVTALGVLSLILNIMCAALNLIRGIHLAEHSLQVAHEEIGNILAFLIPFVACIFQCYLYLFYSPARTTKVVLMLLFICLGNVYLHGLRNLWQILFHIGVAFLSSYQILTRQLQEKQADCGV